METTVEKKPFQWGKLSFILSLVGLLLVLTILGSPLGFLLFFLAIIFSIVAFVKKEKVWPALVGLLISVLIPLLMGVMLFKLLKPIIAPAKEQIIAYTQWIASDAEMRNLMENDDFADYFEYYTEQYFEKQFSSIKLSDEVSTCVQSWSNALLCPSDVKTLVPSVVNLILSQLRPVTEAARENWLSNQGLAFPALDDDRYDLDSDDIDLNQAFEISDEILEHSGNIEEFQLLDDE